MIADESGKGSTWAIKVIEDNDKVALEAAVDVLLNDSDSSVESELLRVLDECNEDFETSGNASRILVERNPTRDPSFLLDHFAGNGSQNLTGPVRWLQKKATGEVPYGYTFFQFGFPRLRQLEPVEVYARLLGQNFRGARVVAAIALGDTADLNALIPLMKALADSSSEVRQQAADAVRRLRHVSGAEAIKSHAVRTTLVQCLQDRAAKVRLAAAQALVSIGDAQSVQHHRNSLPWWAQRERRRLDAILSGDIAPLPKIWPGDRNI